MALPTTREEFKALCLRQLGHNVINIEVSNTQLDDCVDLSLSYYADYHFDGSEKLYYKYEITEIDKTNRYITLPDNIIGAIRIFDLSSSLGSGDFFNIQYQIALNDLYTLTSHSMVPYYMAMTHVTLMQQLLVGQKPIRYNRHINRLYIDMKWDILDVGAHIIVEAYGVIDPEEFTDVWKDRWLIKYCTEQIKKVWGTNTKKYGNMQLPGGLVMTGQKMYDEADQAIQKLEAEMLDSYSLPPEDCIG